MVLNSELNVLYGGQIWLRQFLMNTRSFLLTWFGSTKRSGLVFLLLKTTDNYITSFVPRIVGRKFFIWIWMSSDKVHRFQDDVCVETEDGIKHCKLIAVHAGLERDKDVKEQLKFLKARDTRVPKVEALSGRKNVWDIPRVMDFLSCNLLPLVLFKFLTKHSLT